MAFAGSSFSVSGRTSPERDSVNFIPRIESPKVVFHGKYDEVNPLHTDAEAAL